MFLPRFRFIVFFLGYIAFSALGGKQSNGHEIRSAKIFTKVRVLTSLEYSGKKVSTTVST